MKEKLFSITKNDLEIDYFSGKGAGGQHRNKHQNCVRIKHKDSGTLTTGQSSKERKNNLREAFVNLTKHPKFKLWLLKRVHEINTGKTIDEIVDEQMDSKNIKVEFKNEIGGWE